eukprot:CAMPEP_0197657176 /NCGR_PEP_ID=MMETSP1338-20131121/44470_1 /TAXON_ID=43686 ORGANISM="Pelagodinium beii, Strain RCC1491" /NCGR_SAMPLE_ID=MMETSP1338 /ASSEMBLY_ACC=CAM_ASM_000754 /LENGTH=288 /DNA_ID=CAMNT_0043233489 /DNA_START=37 /DNA_END=900 /DNA_ORIENTATION=-
MALSGTQGSGGAPSGYEPPYQAQGGGPSGSMAAVSQLFARLSQEIEEQKPKNCIHFVVDFLCKHYPEHLHGFASIWQMDPDLERERHEVVNFFKAHKISTAVAAHFTNAGFDTLDTLTTLSPDSLVDVEAFNNVKWLPGHKVRLQQIFGEISARVRAYRQQYGENGQHGQQRKHHHHGHHQHHHVAHHVERRTSSPGAVHRVVHHTSSPSASYMPHAAPPLAIASHVVTHQAQPTTSHQVVHGSPAVHGGYAQKSQGPQGQGQQMGGLSLSPGLNPSNNIFLQNAALP